MLSIDLDIGNVVLENCWDVDLCSVILDLYSIVYIPSKSKSSIVEEPRVRQVSDD